MRDVVCTSDAPNVIGPYSSGEGGGMILVSGQLGLNPATQQIIGGDARQRPNAPFRTLPLFSRPSDPTWTKSCVAECSETGLRYVPGRRAR